MVFPDSSHSLSYLFHYFKKGQNEWNYHCFRDQAAGAQKVHKDSADLIWVRTRQMENQIQESCLTQRCSCRYVAVAAKRGDLTLWPKFCWVCRTFPDCRWCWYRGVYRTGWEVWGLEWGASGWKWSSVWLSPLEVGRCPQFLELHFMIHKMWILTCVLIVRIINEGNPTKYSPLCLGHNEGSVHCQMHLGASTWVLRLPECDRPFPRTGGR